MVNYSAIQQIQKLFWKTVESLPFKKVGYDVKIVIDLMIDANYVESFFYAKHFFNFFILFLTVKTKEKDF